MRAVLCKEFAGPEKLVLADVPLPPLRDGTVRIVIHAAGVNFADTLLITGQYQDKPPLPFTPGMEVAGVVAEAGAGVTQLKRGDRVLASVGRGGFAEEVVTEADGVHRIPDSMDFVTAAGFPVAYSTSYGAFAWRGRLQPGEWVLVLGASGGVGLTAVEIAKAMGARVIAAAGGADKLAVAARAGADHLIDYTREQIRDRVKDITDGRGVDVEHRAGEEHRHRRLLLGLLSAPQAASHGGVLPAAVPLVRRGQAQAACLAHPGLQRSGAGARPAQDAQIHRQGGAHHGAVSAVAAARQN